jgi:hypothetical protein
MKSRTLIAVAVASALGASSAALAGDFNHGVSAGPVSVSEAGPPLVVHDVHAPLRTAGFMPNPQTPLSPNESAPWAMVDEMHERAEHVAMVENARIAVIGHTAEHVAGIESDTVGATFGRVGGTVSGYGHAAAGGAIDAEGADWTADTSLEDSIVLADEGIYSDYYIVTWTPATAGEWDAYVAHIDDSAPLGDLAMGGDTYVLTQRYDIFLLPAEGEDGAPGFGGTAAEDDVIAGVDDEDAFVRAGTFDDDALAMGESEDDGMFIAGDFDADEV